MIKWTNIMSLLRIFVQKVLPFLLLIITALFGIRFYSSLHTMAITTEQTNAIEIVTTERQANGAEITPTRFLYLTQTENCIPTYLRSPTVIGDSETCQCDVIILSYKNECKDTSLPHVQYIFNSSKSTTWTVGRNLLYEAAKERKEKYIHYIFMDDDVKLKKFDAKNTRNPWRMFEESLKTFQPAVVNVHFDNTKKFSKETFPERLNCELTGYIQIYRMDAIFNAFHYQAIDHILPYTPKYDSVSWWYSQLYTIIRCNILFNKEVVVDPRLGVENLKHRKYPQDPLTQDTYNNVVSDIRSETPEKYLNSVEPILQQWLTDRDPKSLLGQQTCKRDLSVHPYRPYKNLA